MGRKDKNNMLSGMMGLLVGDALGSPVQFMTRDKIKNRPEGPVVGMEVCDLYDVPAGSWTDDGSMALATLDSLKTCKKIDLDDIMKKFAEWEVKGKYTPLGFAFDQGNTCTEAIYRYIGGAEAAKCGVTGEYANGNGALMRILPACIYCHMMVEKGEMTIEEAVNSVHSVASLTHNHLRSNICCGMYFFMVKNIIESGSARPLIDILQDAINQALEYYRKDVNNLVQLAHLERIFYLNELKVNSEDDIEASGYVIRTIEAVVWALINTESYKECMLKCANLGDDTDTVAAIAGGLAGLYYGYDSIPGEWIDEMIDVKQLIKMCKWGGGLI